MAQLLPKSHRIIEKGLMEFRPFGKEVNGERIQDVSGITVRANLEYLEDMVTQSFMDEKRVRTGYSGPRQSAECPYS